MINAAPAPTVAPELRSSADARRCHVDRTIEGHIDAAILELQRAKQTLAGNSQFAVARLGDARLCIAAAFVGIVAPPSPLAWHKTES